MSDRRVAVVTGATAPVSAGSHGDAPLRRRCWLAPWAAAPTSYLDFPPACATRRPREAPPGAVEDRLARYQPAVDCAPTVPRTRAARDCPVSVGAT